MAIGPAGPQTLRGTSTGAAARPAERERYIERQLKKTRRQVRGVELSGRLMLLIAAAVGFFLLAAVVDHWIVPGGLSIYGRLAMLAVFLIGAGWFVAREIAPLFVYRINPLFAAQTIEHAKPTLKNTLINFLMLRSNRAAVPEVVLNAVEEQAAANLQHTAIEHVVDRTRVIHIGYLLLAMVSAFCLYYLASPKSPLQTLARVVLPWADIVPPSRVELDEIEPGTTTVFRGERVQVSAVARGLADDEAVTLYFTTTDRQSVDQPVRMYVSSGSGGRHTATLPPSAAQSPASLAGEGLQQDVEYRIEAGDAVSRTYRLSVIQAPNIVVEKLDYDYPAYTKLERESVERTGDIKAVEGTAVTIHALANQPIASAYVDLGGDGKHKQPMKVDGQRATTTLRLALNEDRTSPLYSHYLVRFVNDRGYDNPEPIRYRIEVTPDPAPEIQLLRPEKVETTAPLGAPVAFEIEASDALYGLSDVRIVANVGGEAAFRRNRTIGQDDKTAARLVYRHSERLDRITLGDGKKLKPGDVIEYWAEAVDNKLPKPNVTKTEVRKLIIAEPRQQEGERQQPEENQQNQDGQAQDDNQRADGGQDAKNRDQNQRPQDNQNENRDPGQKQDQRQPGENQSRRGDSQKDERNPNDQRNQGDRNPDAKNDQREDGGKGQPQQNEQPKRDDGQKGADNQNQQAQKAPSAGQQNQKDRQGAGGPDKNRAQGSGEKSEPMESSDANQTGEQRQQSDGQQERQGGNGKPQETDERPVDKSDEGEAFNRILEHAKEKDGKTPEQSERSDGQEKSAPDQKSDDSAKNESGDKGGDKNAANERKGAASGKKEATEQKNPSDGDKAGTEKSQSASGEKSAEQKDGPQKEGPQKGAPKEKSPGEEAKKEKSGEAQSDQRKSEQGKAGKSGGQTPSPQEKARPKDEQRPAGDAGKNAEERPEKSPAHGKNESDTQGENSGDRTGKGQEGGGQNDNRAGKGASGASDAANEGGKAANEQGSGETGEKAGMQERADGETGKSSNEKGDGAKSRPSAGGQQKESDPQAAADAKDDRQKDGQQSGKAKQPQGSEGAKERQQGAAKSPEGSDQKGDTPSDQSGSEGHDQQKSMPQEPNGKGAPTGGGGRAGSDAAPPPDVPRSEPTDDKANLEYSKRATDLALEHLRNQLKDGQPDQDLLDRLGWSKEDLQKLASRWEKMQREAQQPGATGAKAKQNFQEALRSLGLRPNTSRRAASSAADDAARGLRDAARSAPPPEYADEFRAFQRSTSRAEK